MSIRTIDNQCRYTRPALDVEKRDNMVRVYEIGGVRFLFSDLKPEDCDEKFQRLSEGVIS